MSGKNFKLPQAVKKNPRCPLCFAEFDKRFIPSRRDKALLGIKAREKRDPTQAEVEYINSAAWAFFCHFCRISIMCIDPCVGRWEEMYSKGEPILCPACDHKMRFFCTSTGYMQAKCPKKKCQSKVENTAPDRAKEEQKQLYDDAGNPILLPTIETPIAAPNDPTAMQAGQAGTEAPKGLPGETEVKLPPADGNA